MTEEPELTETERAADALREALIYIRGREEQPDLIQCGQRAFEIIEIVNLEQITPPVAPDKETLHCLMSASRIWEWIGSGETSIADIGLRALIVMWTVRPDLIDGMTFEEIGQLGEMKRQRPGLLAREFGATFNFVGGLTK